MYEIALVKEQIQTLFQIIFFHSTLILRENEGWINISCIYKSESCFENEVKILLCSNKMRL